MNMSVILISEISEYTDEDIDELSNTTARRKTSTEIRNRRSTTCTNSPNSKNKNQALFGTILDTISAKYLFPQMVKSMNVEKL